MVRKVEKDRIKILATGNKTLSGFTIIEILVAFFILAIAALAFSSLITDSSRSINLIEERFLANNIAENLALKNLVKDDYLTSSQYDEGEETFLGMPFVWERELATSVERNRIEIEIKVFSENGDLLGKSKVFKEVFAQ